MSRWFVCNLATYWVPFIIMKDIPWYEWLYAITEDGKVWCYPKSWIWWNGAIRKHDWKFLKSWVNSSGYRTICLRNDNKTRTFQLHRVYAQAFIPNPEKKPYINHKNGVRTDNRLENLEWCTPRENSIHSFHTIKTNRYVCYNDYHLWKYIRVWQYDKQWNFIKEFESTQKAWRELWIEQSWIFRCITWEYKTCWWFIWKRL